MADISIDDMINARQQMQPGFKKAQPLNRFENRKDLITDAGHDVWVDHYGEGGPIDIDSLSPEDKAYLESVWKEIGDAEAAAAADPRTAIEAYRNKQAAIAQDVRDDRERLYNTGKDMEDEPGFTGTTGGGTMDPDKPMNRIGAKKPRKNETADSYDYYMDDSGEMDITENKVASGVGQKAKGAAKYAAKKIQKSDPGVEVKETLETETVDPEAEAHLRDIIGDDLYDLFKNHPDRLGGMLKTVMHTAEDAPLIRSAPASDINGIIDARMAARAANEPFSKASPEAGKVHYVSPVTRFDIITPQASALFKQNPDLFYGAIINALGKAFKNAESPDDINAYDAVKALSKKLFGDLDMGSETTAPNVSLTTDFNPGDDDLEMGTTVVNTVDDASKPVDADNVVSEEVDTSKPEYTEAYDKWNKENNKLKGGLFDPSSRKGAKVAGTTAAAAAPIDAAKIAVPDF